MDSTDRWAAGHVALLYCCIFYDQQMVKKMQYPASYKSRYDHCWIHHMSSIHLLSACRDQNMYFRFRCFTSLSHICHSCYSHTLSSSACLEAKLQGVADISKDSLQGKGTLKLRAMDTRTGTASTDLSLALSRHSLLLFLFSQSCSKQRRGLLSSLMPQSKKQ